MGKFVQYLQDSRAELKKVVWPTKKETTKHTLIVIGVSFVCGRFFGRSRLSSKLAVAAGHLVSAAVIS
jgi:preprotein translocase SecE subunit